MSDCVSKKNLYEKAAGLHAGGLTCSEAVMKGILEGLGRPVDDALYNMASPFSGGAMSGELCGVLSGAALAAAVLLPDWGKQPNRAKALTKRLVKEFREKEGCVRCEDLTRERGKGTPEQTAQCRRMVGETAAHAGALIARTLGMEVTD